MLDKIEQNLKKRLEDEISYSHGISENVGDVVKHLSEYALRGGKRFRPSAFMLGYHYWNGSDKEAAYSASASVELIHCFALIHDDVQDNAETRRGEPAMQKVFDEFGKKFKNDYGKNFGENLAIGAGDVAVFLGLEILLESDFNPELKCKAVRDYVSALKDTAYGQILDLISCDDETEEAVLLRHELKTAKYSFEAPIRLGAILAGAPDEELEKITRYALPVGIAFQLKDDIIGMFGKNIGKPNKLDVEEGKRTLLVIKSLDSLLEERTEDSVDKYNFMVSCLGNKISDDDFEKFRNLVEETGSLEYSEELCFHLVCKGNQVTKEMNCSHEIKIELCALANRAIVREF